MVKLTFPTTGETFRMPDVYLARTNSRTLVSEGKHPTLDMLVERGFLFPPRLRSNDKNNLQRYRLKGNSWSILHGDTRKKKHMTVKEFKRIIEEKLANAPDDAEVIYGIDLGLGGFDMVRVEGIEVELDARKYVGNPSDWNIDKATMVAVLFGEQLNDD